MKPLLRLGATLLLASGACTSLQGQQALPPADTRSPVLAGALELFLPTVGFAYAGDWKRGLPPNIVRVGAVVSIVATDWCREDGDDACAVLGLLLGVGHVWATIGAVNTARDRNRRSEPSSVGLLFRPASNGSLRVGVSLRHQE